LDTITLKASEKITVNSITLERFGYSTAADVESVWLEDGDGNVSDPVRVDIYIRKKLEESDILKKKDKIIKIHKNEVYDSPSLPQYDKNLDKYKEPLLYSIYSTPLDGQVQILGNQTIRYIPKHDSLANDYFQIKASNKHESIIISYTVQIYDDSEEILEYHNWYLRGYPDYTIRPEGIVTREELATIIYRIDTDSKEPPALSLISYSDVERDRWSYDAIMYLTNLNVLTGYPDGTFRPAQTMTRAEFAAVVARYANLSSNTTIPYYDVNPEHWARKQIAQVTSRGFFTDDENGYFGVDFPLQRGYAERVINRLLERDDSTAMVNDIPFSDLPSNHPYYHSLVEAFTAHYCRYEGNGRETCTTHNYPWAYKN
jgi:hypothetical protein